MSRNRPKQQIDKLWSKVGGLVLITISLGASLFKIVFYIYLFSAHCYVLHLFNGKKIVGRIATTALAAGWALHTVTLVVRTVAAGRPPFLNLYEYVISLTWGFVRVSMTPLRSKPASFNPTFL